MSAQHTVPFVLEVVEVPVPPDFFPAVSPDRASVPQGTMAAYQVTFAGVAGYAHPIALECAGLPEAAVAIFDTNPAQVTDTVNLLIATDAVAPGVYELQLVATEITE